jgi:hypothetical protein
VFDVTQIIPDKVKMTSIYDKAFADVRIELEEMLEMVL